jgi:hypothetical protein
MAGGSPAFGRGNRKPYCKRVASLAVFRSKSSGSGGVVYMPSMLVGINGNGNWFLSHFSSFIMDFPFL